MIRLAGIDIAALPDEAFDNPLGESTGAATIFGTTGGVMEAALRTVYEILEGKPLETSVFVQCVGFRDQERRGLCRGQDTARGGCTYAQECKDSPGRDCGRHKSLPVYRGDELSGRMHWWWRTTCAP